MERPHSRKVKTEEGTAEVKKGEKVENVPMAGDGGAPIAGNKKDCKNNIDRGIICYIALPERDGKRR